MKVIKDIRDFFIFGNVWLGCCAAAQGLLTFLLIDAIPSLPVLAILFLSTFLMYNLRIVIDKEWVKHHSDQHTAPHLQWMAYHSSVLKVWCRVALVAIGLFGVWLQFTTIFVLAAIALVALTYFSPLLSRKQGGLRQVPGLKTVLIALVWSSSTILVPLVESNVMIDPLWLTVLLIKRFIVAFTLALLFDIRDEKTDKQNKLHTIATYLGERNSKLLCLLLLVIDALLMYVYDYPINPPLFFSLLFFLLVTAMVVINTNNKRSVYYYLFVVDGMFLLQYVVIRLAMER